MVELTKESFDTWIKRKKTAFVLFYWDYCKPCKAMKNKIEKLLSNIN